MKKLNYLFILVVTTVFISCQFSENIYISDDGTGKMSLQFDGSEFIKMGSEIPGNENVKSMDSLLVFKELLLEKKDSIALLPKDEQELLKFLEDYTMHMVMNSEEGIMNFDLFTNFKQLSDLKNVLQIMGKIGAIGSGNGELNPMNNFNMGGGTNVKYSFEKNKFKRKSIIENEELHQKTIDSLGPVEVFMVSSNYTLKYHFPRPVKSVSNEKALFSADLKTVTIEVPFIDYMKNPEILDVEVVLKKK